MCKLLSGSDGRASMSKYACRPQRNAWTPTVSQLVYGAQNQYPRACAGRAQSQPGWQKNGETSTAQSEGDPSRLGRAVTGLSGAWRGSTSSVERPQKHGKSSMVLRRQKARLSQSWMPTGQVGAQEAALPVQTRVVVQLLPSCMTWARRAQPLRQQQGRTLCTTLGMMPRCWKLCCPPVMV